MKTPTLARLLLALLLVATAAAAQPPTDPTPPPDPMAERWKEVVQLVEDQRFETAATKAGEIRADAHAAGDETVYTRALVQETLLRVALQGYETAVRQLRETPWPETPRLRAVVELYYAHTLVLYQQAYSWELRQRERSGPVDAVDLDAWTLDQVVTEAHRSYGRVWAQRDDWGTTGLDELAEFFDAGNYPAHVRGTLRDTVAYLWRDLLVDTSLWRPEHSNGVYKLNRRELIHGGGRPTGGADVDMTDPDVHPLLKATALLGDLETWHRDGGRPEAAFESRRVRAETLWPSLDQADEHEAILENLVEHLDVLGQPYPWWAMGQATRAELLRQTGDPNRLIQAREAALAGRQAHPKTVGGKRCDLVVRQVEQPHYALDSGTHDGVGKRSILVRHKNLEKVHFRAYAFDPEKQLLSQEGHPHPWIQLNEARLASLLRKEVAAEWTVDLPSTPDFREHRTWVTPPLGTGSYTVVASARADFQRDDNLRLATPLLLNDLVLVRTSHVYPAFIVRAGSDGRPRAGVRVRLYRFRWGQPSTLFDEKTSAADGSVEFPDAKDEQQKWRFFVVARDGDEVAFLQDVTFNRPDTDTGNDDAMIYTDRSVYRPGQKILFKVVGYHRNADGRFKALRGKTVDVELQDANYENVGTLKLKLNGFGSASGEFTIPHGRLLGNWTLNTSIGGWSTLQVEEYKRPTFEVALDEPKETLRLNRRAAVQGTARYYFGLPVTGGKVAWRVTREPFWPIWWRQCFFAPPGHSQTEVVAQGTSTLNADGHFDVDFLPEADERRDDDLAVPPVFLFRVEADVTDDGGETRSGSRTFRLGRVTVEASFVDPAGFLDAGQENELHLRRTDLNGAVRAGEARWRLLRVVQPETPRMPSDIPVPPAGEGVFQTPGDLLRERWGTENYRPENPMRDWEDGEEVASGVLEHGEDGMASLALPPLDPGVYRWRYSTQDPFDATFEMARDVAVAAKKAGNALNVPAFLRLQETAVPLGGTLRVLVGSALPDQEATLRIARRDRPIEERRIRGLAVVEIPVGNDERGGFGLALDVLHDHQFLHLQENVTVPWDDKRLDVTLETFRDRLRPGDRETWKIHVRGSGEETLAKDTVEVLASMYDRSLDIFAVHRPPNPLAWYPVWRGYLPYSTSLQRAGMLWTERRGVFQQVGSRQPLQGGRLRDIDGYGFGGPGDRALFRVFARGSVMRRRMTNSLIVAESSMMSLDVSEAQGLERNLKTLSDAPPAPAPPPPAPEGPAPENDSQAPAAEIRSDFKETAFWEPHLLLGEDGTVSFEFEVPDSLTEWNVWAQALTADLRGGQLHEKVRTVKELMIRPYLPRFLRTGDELELRVLVQAAGEETLSGDVTFDLVDPETEESVAEQFGLTQKKATFTVEPGGSVERRFSIKVPDTLQDVAVRVVARSGKNSDGELRPLPVLPSRIHLMQTRFVTLKDAGERTMTFDDLLAEDATRINDQLVVTVDGQLFYGVLAALPYLVNYPYECSEQTLNRFLSTSILSSLYEHYPAVERMARQFSERETQFESFDGDDPNRRMAMVETPWLVESRGGGDDVLNVLSPNVAETQRRSALKKLEELQMPSGAFPWFPGGPPSTYMTLYVLDGLSRALEFDVDVPRGMIESAWTYVYNEDKRNPRFRTDSPASVAYVVYLLSAYPDLSWTGGVYTEDDRKVLLDVVADKWRSLGGRTKWQAALALQRAGRDAPARAILEAVMDSSRTTEDEGTFWMPEDRAWLWYNDTIESHAFALRAMDEIAPQDKRRHGLVQWLFLNKKLNHWKSTRATAEVIYSLAHYLKQEGQLGIREEARVRIGPADAPVRTATFVFEPDVYTGKANRVVLEGASIDERAASTTVSKETPGLMFATAAWHFSTEQPPEEARGDFFTVTREFFRRVHDGREWTLEPLQPGDRVEVGDQVEVRLRLTSKHPAEYVHLRDPRGAGFEPESLRSGYRWENVGYYEEVRDSGANFFFERLPVGEVVLRHRLRATVAGTFRVAPATVQSMYAPDFAAYSSGVVLGVR